MNEFVDREAVLSIIMGLCETQGDYDEAYDKIMSIPAIKEKKGKWKYGYCKAQEIKCYYCSNCGNDAYWDTDYGQQLFDFCPRCGCEMEGKGWAK